AFVETMKSNGVSAPDILLKLKVAEEAGAAGREEDLVNGVHAAIEIGSQTGDFDLAKQLATNTGIPEKDQTTLRNTIRANESVFKDKQEAVPATNTIDFPEVNVKVKIVGL
ncbi:hypothetical protein LCGC14_1225300, partial [marine sediment metagenome]